MSRKRFPVWSFTLYVLAGLLLLYTIWAAVHSFGYIAKMVARNQLVVKGNVFEIASFHMSNFGQYAAFAVILSALGRILQTSSASPARSGNRAQTARETPGDDVEDEVDDDDFEDWIKNNKEPR